MAVGVLILLPWYPRTASGNTVLSGFFEQMGSMGEKRKRWWLVRESLGGAAGRNVFREKLGFDL